MPSSLIFAGLVAIWLLLLVPAVARRQQEVARPSPAALSGRVLERPGQRRRTQEVRQVEQAEQSRSAAIRSEGAEQETPVAAVRTAEPLVEEEVPTGSDDAHWERPRPRYRPGRGGFDPEAAALAARARYVIRQRVVLVLLAAMVTTALIAVFTTPGMWWLHAVVDLMLVGYLVYLRRQVRLEEAIRERRAARMAGTRRLSAAEDPELDEWARRGREAALGETERSPAAEGDDLAETGPEPDGRLDAAADERDPDPEDSPEEGDLVAEDEDPERVKGTGEPLGVLPAKPRTVRPEEADEQAEPESALPRLEPAPPPPLPAGTTLVEVDEEELELSELGTPTRSAYRRAAGQ
ncbi:gephyrin-like molybdotransferase receptor GlpR [Pseudonocardia hispaniensis]|uniref:Gephyrin-like molybdotransferase receptor GlpR n=1 Tax=Pseudonocardia hispaniensis TaxID=904933 RepID=A0ABW1J1A9_9PSEU